MQKLLNFLQAFIDDATPMAHQEPYTKGYLDAIEYVKRYVESEERTNAK